ncbi:hypothetical protein KABACHOK_02360 [Brevundimonas phage vB_BpoS-Kabachok]|uniref:Uncharacterized protein n=1 Tax=Brevundimonas phage vB_BpoS-Kabachok TaxID=2948600 RepID=A0A9E7MQ46_9CAUD|nr:hypothetical protein KABACHOK_02360 [Brevundimonas phage vB_BpoS-Kabachok]
MDEALTPHIHTLRRHLKDRGWMLSYPSHLEQDVAGVQDQAAPTPVEIEDAIVALLRTQGLKVIRRPTEADRWEPAFTPQFYEAGGDEVGEVYCRIDLPEGLYYAFQDAAREGLAAASERLSAIDQIEKSASEFERAPGFKSMRKTGILDGIVLTPQELRGLASIQRSMLDLWKKALDRADTRKHKR